MKKIFGILVLFVCLSLILSAGVLAAGTQVNLQFNGKKIPSDVPPVIDSGRTLVPVRVISESLGADVDWDSGSKKVTVIKGDNKIELTVDKKELFKNGSKISDLDVPAKIINGRTVVPIRFVSETLGAAVNWNGETKTVEVIFDEKKDGMTAEELMQKSYEAMQKYKTYKFKGTAKIDINMTGINEKISSDMTMEGIFKNDGSKNEMYIKQTMEMPLPGQQTMMTMTSESYTDGTDMYINANGAGWQKFNLGADLTKLTQNQDPQTALLMMKEMGLIVSFGNDTSVNGKDCYTMVVKIDSDKYKSFMRDVLKGIDLSSLSPAPPTGEFQKLFDELIDGMEIDMLEKVYVEKNSFLMSRAVITGNIKMAVEGNKLTETIVADMSIFDYGVAVTMPAIKK